MNGRHERASMREGPLTELFPQAEVDNGAQTGVAQGSAVSFWTAGGFTWRI